MTVQATAWPPTLSVPLHWLTADVVAAAFVTSGHVNRRKTARRKAPARTDLILGVDLGLIAFGADRTNLAVGIATPSSGSG
jgi:hypothetical protein